MSLLHPIWDIKHGARLSRKVPLGDIADVFPLGSHHILRGQKAPDPSTQTRSLKRENTPSESRSSR
jgi:hypothetical protein